jgi:hypothetical protein
MCPCLYARGIGKLWVLRVTGPMSNSWPNKVVHAREGVVTVGSPDYLGYIQVGSS